MNINISATSALVLNWTDRKIWQTHPAAAYMDKLDLSEGQSLLDLFSKDENFMHTQTISCRKFFIRNKVCSFLEELQRQGKRGQVLILAAGLAPMSLEIAARYPSSTVFDVDQYNMPEKQMLIGGQLPNIRFCACDITNVRKLDEALVREGFRSDVPVMTILEGIIYYLTKDALGNLLRYLSRMNSVVVAEFGLIPEQVNEKTRFFLENVFATIKQQAKLDFITFYSDEAMSDLIRCAGFASVTLTNFQTIQKERTGNEYPFAEPDSSWIKAVYAK